MAKCFESCRYQIAACDTAKRRKQIDPGNARKSVPMRFLNRFFGNKDVGLIAVIDVETTGLNPYRQDRIIELAALVTNLDGTVLREFVTLVNPERDIGPTYIHGINTGDVLSAPRFGEIAGSLIEVLDGCVTLVGHNVRFDHSFLTKEFERLGHTFPNGPTLCTMQLAGGGSLASACANYGITFEGQAHTALHDARATTHLLASLLKDAPRLASNISHRSAIAWPYIAKSLVGPITRDDSRNQRSEAPDYLKRLLTRVQCDLPSNDQDSAKFAYIALLEQVLEDRHINERQGQDLIDLANHWSIMGDQIQTIHWNYLLRLVTAALSDSVLTDPERRDLQQVASLLGIDSKALEEMLETVGRKEPELLSQSSAHFEGATSEGLAGKLVCFTGQSQCRLKGNIITREVAEKIAAGHRLKVAKNVTKELDIPVVADSLTEAGKRKKARQYGIRVIHEHVFWKALGVEVE